MQVSSLSKKIREVYRMGVKIHDDVHYFTVLATHRTTSHRYYIKVISKARMREHQLEKYVDLEKTIMASLSLSCEEAQQNNQHHPFIPRLYEIYEDNDHVCFVLEHASRGNLLYHIRDRGSLSEEVTRFYAAELVEAVGFLHKNNVLHRDIRPENILISDQGHIILAGFGRSTKLGKEVEFDRGSFVGLPEYRSPEAVESENVGKASDIWGMGCVVYYMLTGDSPFKGVSEAQVKEKISHYVKSGDLAFPSGISEDAKKMVNGLLGPDPKDRLGARENGMQDIKKHTFFAQCPWGQLHLRNPPLLEHGVFTRDQKLAFKRDDSVFLLNSSVSPYYNSEFESKQTLVEPDPQVMKTSRLPAKPQDRSCKLCKNKKKPLFPTLGSLSRHFDTNKKETPLEKKKRCSFSTPCMTYRLTDVYIMNCLGIQRLCSFILRYILCCWICRDKEEEPSNSH
jgi:3-phosphoinositide dependent protein kinase-1